jgi:hypothetical protein
LQFFAGVHQSAGWALCSARLVAEQYVEVARRPRWWGWASRRLRRRCCGDGVCALAAAEALSGWSSYPCSSMEAPSPSPRLPRPAPWALLPATGHQRHRFSVVHRHARAKVSRTSRPEATGSGCFRPPCGPNVDQALSAPRPPGSPAHGSPERSGCWLFALASLAIFAAAPASSSGSQLPGAATGVPKVLLKPYRVSFATCARQHQIRFWPTTVSGRTLL